MNPPAMPPVRTVSRARLRGTYDVTDKLDGHRLILRRGEAYRRAGERNEWDRLPASIRGAALSCWLDGELILPGQPASAVETALANGGAGLEFRPFRIPGCGGSAVDEHAQLIRWGFTPPRYLGRFTAAQIRARLDAWLDAADEGVVLRPVDGGDWLKFKRVESADLPVVAVHRAPSALICRLPSGRTIRIGSGLHERERADLGPGDVGRIAEISYQSTTPAGSLRHARFARWRDDLPRAPRLPGNKPDLV